MTATKGEPARRLRDQTITHHDDELGQVTLHVEVHRYVDQRPFAATRHRIDFVSSQHGPWSTLTVNEPAVRLDPGEFLVKVHEGDTWKSALASGLFVDTGRRERLGYTEAQVWRLAEGVVL